MTYITSPNEMSFRYRASRYLAGANVINAVLADDGGRRIGETRLVLANSTASVLNDAPRPHSFRAWFDSTTMSDPLAYLPLALAGANGTMNGVPVRRLVAAGVALLQRSAPLVRALHGHRSAILLPNAPQVLVALASSDGRAASLLSERSTDEQLANAIQSTDATVVFTISSLAHRLPTTVPRVLLDEAPERAVWISRDDARTLDLALHGGLRLEGEAEVEGADEDVLVANADDAMGAALGTPITHRRLMECARATVARERLAARDHTLALAPYSQLFGLVVGGIAPLLAGGRVTAHDTLAPSSAIAMLEGEGVSTLVASPSTFAGLLEALAQRGRALDAPVLQRCFAGGEALDDALARRWYHETGVLLHRGDVLGADGAMAAWDEAVDRPR